MIAFMICGRHAFDAQEKQVPRESCLNFLYSLVLPITWEHSGYKQNPWIFAIYNFMMTFQLCAKGIFAVKVVVYNAKAYVDHLSMFVTPLSLFFIRFISESVTLYPFVQMKLSPMRWRLHQTAPAVSGNMGMEP